MVATVNWMQYADVNIRESTFFPKEEKFAKPKNKISESNQ